MGIELKFIDFLINGSSYEIFARNINHKSQYELNVLQMLTKHKQTANTF
jgi:hypothetical protein